LKKKEAELLKSVFQNDEITIQKKYGLFIINGKYYEFSSKDGSLILKPVNTEKMETKIRKVKLIAKKLKDQVDGEKILTESLMTRLSDSEVDKLEKLVFHKERKYTVKTREHHCVDMKVGNMIIPLID